MANRRGKMETVTDFIFWGSKIIADGDCSHEIKRCSFLERKGMTNLDNKLKSRDITLPTKVIRQSYGFSTSHVWMWELDHKESWALKNWCFWTVVLEKTLEIPLDCKEINQSILKEISPEYSLERLVLKVSLQYFGHLMLRFNSVWKYWGQEKKGRTEGEMARWHHWLNWHEFEQTPGDSGG